MQASEITVDWLKSIPYKVFPSTINVNGVILKPLKSIVDGRGDVVELWSRPWVEEFGLSTVEHAYQSATDFGVVKCWHLHENHTDQFTVTRGKLQVTLVDLREDSPTFGYVNTAFLGTQQLYLLKIPPMIMHGWKALSFPEVIVVNFQSHIYSSEDECKFPWDCVLEDIWEPKNG